MKPLVITATPNICWLHPDVPYPQTVNEMVQEARLCGDAGAAILHLHAETHWSEAIRALRSSTELIVQCGMSSLPIKDRMDVFTEHADMISIILSHHDEAFARVDVHTLHPREELEEYARLSAEYGTRLEMEVWHAGSIWNLNYLIKKDAVRPPYITTLFFDWPGGSWSPATVQEYTYRRSYLPNGCFVTVSVMGSHQVEILTAAILNGDHIRVGTEDYPYTHDEKIATTHELVDEAVQIAKAVGRPIASPNQAREMTGLS